MVRGGFIAQFTDMEKTAIAFYWLGRFLKLNGRRLERERVWARARVLQGGWERNTKNHPDKSAEAYPCLLPKKPIGKPVFGAKSGIVFATSEADTPDDIAELQRTRNAAKRARKARAT